MAGVQENFVSSFETTPLLQNDNPVKIETLRWGISQNLRDFRIISLLDQDGQLQHDEGLDL